MGTRKRHLTSPRTVAGLTKATAAAATVIAFAAASHLAGRVLPAGGAGSGAGTVDTDASPLLGYPAGLALAPDGRVVVADRRLNRVFALDLEGRELEPIAGTGEPGFAGDGGPALDARLLHPEWIEFAPDGDLLIADRGNRRVRRVDAVTGRIETIAGTGREGASGDGGRAVEASFAGPFGVLADREGNVYVFDTEAHSIRRIDAATGIIRTVVGTGEPGFGGDGDAGTSALLARPHNGVFDDRGRLVFGDSFNQRIRRWDPGTALVETVAGSGVEGVSDPGTPAAEARFTYFGGIVVEPDGSLLYTGLEGRIMRLRAVDGRPEAGRLEEVVGAEAGLRGPYGILRLPDGRLVVADAGNAAIRRVDPTTGEVETLTGSP